MSIAAFGVRKPVVANLVMFAIIGAGLAFGVGLRREFFPEVRPETVTIAAPYPGASPEEIESSLAIKIEDRVADLEDVKEVNTTIREGLCTVNIEFEPGVDISRMVFDVQSEMDALQDLPPEVERITTAEFEPAFPTINISIFGDADERTMKSAALDMRDDLRSLPGLSRITADGFRTSEITVEVPPAVLIEHKLSLPAIAERIRQAMTELPAGSVKSSTANIAVRTIGAEETVSQVRDIVVKAGSGGQVLRVGDLAEVTAGFADSDLRVRLNGKPAVSLTVYKVGDEDAVSMAELVKAYAAGRKGEGIEPTWGERASLLLQKLRNFGQFEVDADIQEIQGRPNEFEIVDIDVDIHTDLAEVSPRMQAYLLGASKPPVPGELAITTDLARFIVGRLDLLTRNALWGGILVLITLVVLLNARVAFWVAIVAGRLAAGNARGDAFPRALAQPALHVRAHYRARAARGRRDRRRREHHRTPRAGRARGARRDQRHKYCRMAGCRDGAHHDLRLLPANPRRRSDRRPDGGAAVCRFRLARGLSDRSVIHPAFAHGPLAQGERQTRNQASGPVLAHRSEIRQGPRPLLPEHDREILRPCAAVHDPQPLPDTRRSNRTGHNLGGAWSRAVGSRLTCSRRRTRKQSMSRSSCPSARRSKKPTGSCDASRRHL